jgi:hypothetical protein
MNDMSQVIIPKSDQINADDLIAGPLTIKIADVIITPGTEQPVTVRYDGDAGRPWKPCKSMSRVMVSIWGPDAKAYVGRSVTLYCDPTVKWGGMEVGGIRISHMSHMDRTTQLMLSVTKANRKPFTVRPMVVASPSDKDQKIIDTTRAMISDVTNAAPDDLAGVLDNPEFVKRRNWLRENKPELSKALEDAVTQAYGGDGEGEDF